MDLFEELGYPVIKELSRGYKLVAHPNCPAVMNKHELAVLTPRPDHSSELNQAIEEGQQAFQVWAHETLSLHYLWPSRDDDLSVASRAFKASADVLPEATDKDCVVLETSSKAAGNAA